MPQIRTFYDELGIDRDAGPSEIKRAFRDVAKQYHPDVNPPEKKDWAHEQMSRVNFIADTLLNSETRAEYDDLVSKYERGFFRRPRRTARQEYALQREYARVSVEIMNLSGKYSNCRLKMVLGGCVSGLAMLVLIVMSVFSSGAFSLTVAFARFLVLVGLIMTGIGISDYMARGQYRQQIRELQMRRSDLRRRMYEAWTVY